MLYQMYELSHAVALPLRYFADFANKTYNNPFNPVSQTAVGKTFSAGYELFERMTRRYAKPDFDIAETVVEGKKVKVEEEVVWEKPFCRLLHFKRRFTDATRPKTKQPTVLLVAPMSGHFATLLRGTVAEFVKTCDVYITDWQDARNVPMIAGQFNLSSYIDYVIEILEHLGQNTHVVGVCQPSVPVLAAVALMAEEVNTSRPASMTFMGGPIDTRNNPTEVNRLAEERGIQWFKNNVIMRVPLPNVGFMRQVYPGFLQLSGFLGMNIERHMGAHHSYFQHLISGDEDEVEKHVEFYNEYLAVMDLPSEFFLETVEKVFIKHCLPEGNFEHHGKLVKPETIKDVALFTIEGEKDDITGVGQTKAAHKLCSGLPEKMKEHYEQEGVGHYGVFNGFRFRRQVAPKMNAFFHAHDKG